MCRPTAQVLTSDKSHGTFPVSLCSAHRSSRSCFRLLFFFPVLASHWALAPKAISAPHELITCISASIYIIHFVIFLCQHVISVSECHVVSCPCLRVSPSSLLFQLSYCLFYAYSFFLCVLLNKFVHALIVSHKSNTSCLLVTVSIGSPWPRLECVG